MMRITNNMLINNSMNYMNNNLERLQKFQTQLSTGKKINVPSDDPVVAAKALKLRTDVAEVNQFKKNSTDSYSWMDITENTLGQTVDIIQRARELAVQASNGTLTPDDRDKIKQEVAQLRGQSIQLANVTYAGRYVFSGYQTDTKLMNDDGSYNCSVGSNETAVIKGGLLNLTAKPIDTTSNTNSFQISADGSNYSTITLTSGIKYNGTPPNTLDALAKEIQNNIVTASGTNTLLADVKVANNNGRIELTLRNTMDTNGNRLKIFLKEGKDLTGTNDILGSLNIKTDPITLSNVSKSEDINYQVGISDSLNVNVLGTDLYGSGKKDDVGVFMASFNRFIDALEEPDDNKSYISSQTLTVNASSKLDLNADPANPTNQFDIKLTGMANFVPVTLTAKTYDGSTGKTLDNLVIDMKTAIDSALSLAGLSNTVTVTNQNGKITINENSGQKITLQEGPPNNDALKPLKFFTDTNKTVSSTTSDEGLQGSITSMESLKDRVMSVRSDIGARMNRAELTNNRLDSDNVNFTKLMSDNEDVDMAETITNLTNEQNVYRASLAGTAKIIMPTLIDFLR